MNKNLLQRSWLGGKISKRVALSNTNQINYMCVCSNQSKSLIRWEAYALVYTYCVIIKPNNLFLYQGVLYLSGSLELNLNALPKPVKSASKCKLTQLPDFNPQAKVVSLFEAKKLNGFWPVYQMVEGNPQLQVE